MFKFFEEQMEQPIKRQPTHFIEVWEIAGRKGMTNPKKIQWKSSTIEYTKLAGGKTIFIWYITENPKQTTSKTN